MQQIRGDLATRPSLLSRLRQHLDQDGWHEFFEMYNGLIYRVGLKRGLAHAEAQDLVQDVMIIVARKLAGFRYDPARGLFKSWLLEITRHRIRKLLDKRMPLEAHRDDSETGRTATIDRIPDRDAVDLESAWDKEWKHNLWEVALARVKTRFKPKQFQVFDLLVLKEWSVKEVTRALRVSAPNAYVIRHRISGALKKEVNRLQRTRLPTGKPTA